MCPWDEGLRLPGAERWAAPEPAPIPLGDRTMYPWDEGLS